MRSVYPGRISPSFVALVALVLLLLLWQVMIGRLDDRGADEQLGQLSVAQRYHSRKEALLRAKRFDAHGAARRLRAPETLPSGEDLLDPSVETYVKRLDTFVNRYLSRSSILPELNQTIHEVKNRTHLSLASRLLPRRIWSTDKQGPKAVDQYFNLWPNLLSLPLSPPLLSHLDGLSPDNLGEATSGEKWQASVSNDDDIDKHITEWSGEISVREANQSASHWGTFWSTLPFGVLRSDVYRYFALLAEGGIYADSDTAPLVHPYLWGLESDSIVDPQLEVYLNINSGYYQDDGSVKPFYTPPYPGVRESGRGRTYTDTNDNDNASAQPQAPDSVPSILSDVSMVISIEWDSSIAFSLRGIFQWGFRRLERSISGGGYARSLQMAQHLIVAKPHHPIFLDTLATITELVETGSLGNLGALDLTGPGPFTDAVLRYLLVRYGVTPNELRSLPRSVRVGDIIILQEESLLASDHVFNSFVKQLLSSIGLADNVWFCGTGYQRWGSAGKVVARHGLRGTWKNQGW